MTCLRRGFLLIRIMRLASSCCITQEGAIPSAREAVKGWVVPDGAPLDPLTFPSHCVPCSTGCQEQATLPLGFCQTHFAYPSEWRLSDLSFCMFLLLRSSLSYVKKAIRLVSVYFKQNGC